MLLLSFLVLSIIIGWIRGGELSRFQNINLKRLWILIISLGLQLFIILFGMNNVTFALDYIKELYILSYVFLVIYLLLNITNRQLVIVFVGVILNGLAFIFNNGKMPVSVEGLKLAGLNNVVDLVEANKLALYAPLTDGTKYGFLSKLIIIQKPFPYNAVLSIGDVVIALGLFIFIQSVMLDLVNDRHSGLSFR